MSEVQDFLYEYVDRNIRSKEFRDGSYVFIPTLHVDNIQIKLFNDGNVTEFGFALKHRHGWLHIVAKAPKKYSDVDARGAIANLFTNNFVKPTPQLVTTGFGEGLPITMSGMSKEYSRFFRKKTSGGSG